MSYTGPGKLKKSDFFWEQQGTNVLQDDEILICYRTKSWNGWTQGGRHLTRSVEPHCFKSQLVASPRVDVWRLIISEQGGRPPGQLPRWQTRGEWRTTFPNNIERCFLRNPIIKQTILHLNIQDASFQHFEQCGRILIWFKCNFLGNRGHRTFKPSGMYQQQAAKQRVGSTSEGNRRGSRLLTRGPCSDPATGVVHCCKN